MMNRKTEFEFRSSSLIKKKLPSIKAIITLRHKELPEVKENDKFLEVTGSPIPYKNKGYTSYSREMEGV